MLKGLFKSAWKSDSVEKRLRFIDEVDDSVSANQTILVNLARNDVDATVRHAAMVKISDLQALYDLWQLYGDSDNLDNNKNRQLAETTFCHVIQATEFTQAEVDDFLTKNPQSNLLIAKYCTNADIQKHMLLSLDDSEQANLIAGIPYSSTRVMLAENIHHIDALEVARKNLKGKDKSAEKIIKAKIDSFHAKQKLALENIALVTSICEKMESLARYVNWSDEIRVTFFSLSKQWNTLDFSPDEVEKKRYDEAFSTVEADVKHNMGMVLSQQNQKKLVNALDVLCEKIAVYPLDTLLAESAGLTEKLNDLCWQLNKESETFAHTASIHERFIRAKEAMDSALSLCRAVSDLREINSREIKSDGHESDVVNRRAKSVLQATSRITKHSSWSNSFPALVSVNEAVLEANSVLNATLNATKNARQQAKNDLDNLHQRINRIFGSTKRGDVKRAQRELAAVTKSVSRYEGNDRQKLDDRMEVLAVAVGKMGDWKDFAIEPKLVELCEQMEALPELERVSKNPSADNLAKKIKSLQAAWKALGNSDISETYWPRFKEAGDTAYEPCAEFFRQRRKIQQGNLQSRDPLVEKMKDLFESTDWEAKPDYKAVEDSLSQIMQSWKKIKDVEPGPGQKQWKKLANFKDQINQKLDIEYDRNIAAKYRLTEQFEQMLEQEVNEQTLDKLKFIQSKWKQVGVTRRKQDQTAWLRFKAASDAVYEKIQGLRQEKRAVEDEQISAYKYIHSQIHQLAKATENLAQSDIEFEALKEQYKALPALPVGLPEKLVERLAHDYAKACDAYASAKDRLTQAKLDNELAILATKAQLCSELEQRSERKQSSEKTEQEALDALQGNINALEISNKEYLRRFSTRLEKARDTDRKAYGEARRLLLIECEILLDVESPKEDKDLRLQIQLDKMKAQGIGNAPIDVSAKIDELKLEWLCMPGAEATLQKQFDRRLSRLLKEK